jgi:hypothetical protein
MKSRNIGILVLVVIGVAVAAFLIPGAAARNGEREAQEEDTALSALPEAVRATLLEACGDAEPVEIEREIEGGKVIYEAEVYIDGVEHEIEIAEDGTLIGTDVEDEEAEAIEEDDDSDDDDAWDDGEDEEEDDEDEEDDD